MTSYTFVMLIVVFLLQINLIQDPVGIKDEFEVIKKRISKINNENDEDEQTGNEFGNSLVDDVSRDSDDVYSSINEQNPYDHTNEMAKKLPKVLDQAENKKYIEDLAKKLNDKLDLKNEIAGLSNDKAWNGLYKHFEMNFGNYCIDGKLSIQLHIRYFLCCYVILFIPGEFAFFYPALWPRLIPDFILSHDIMKDAITELRVFQNFVKAESSKSLLITFYFGRQNSVLEDLLFLLKIPSLIFSDPLAIVRELSMFEIKSEGYKDYKAIHKPKIKSL